MFKKIILLAALVFICSTAFAEPSTVSVKMDGMVDTTSVLAKFSNGIGIGYIKSGSTEAAVARWRPDFKFGDLGLGFDVNIPMGDKKPTDIDAVVLRYAQYFTPKWGLHYGILTNLTIGQGLLVNNYTTLSKGSLLQTNRQTGIKGYYNSDFWGFEGTATWSSLYIFRVTEKVTDKLILGQYYIVDNDGVNYTRPDGSKVQYPRRSGLGVDATYPLWYGANAYAEYARLIDYGGGFSAGIAMAYDVIIGKIGIRAERRLVDKNFVPGYFNENYETNPIDLASYEATGAAKDGYRFQLDGTVLDRGAFWAVLEGYNGTNTTLKAEASAKVSEEYFVSGSFSQPNFIDARSLNFEEGAIVTGKVGYKLNPFSTVMINYRKAYDPTAGRVVESQWYEMSLAF